MRADPIDPDVTEEDVLRTNPYEYFKEAMNESAWPENQKQTFNLSLFDDEDKNLEQQNIQTFMDSTQLNLLDPETTMFQE
jgi:hypothetical protein